MRSQAIWFTLLIVAGIGTAGCARNGSHRVGSQEANHSAAFLSPGAVTVTNPGPAGSEGSGTVWVKWDPTQVTLQDAAKWQLKRSSTLTREYPLESATPIAAGEYTIVLSTCSKPGYKPPSSSKKINVRSGETTLVTVRYKH